MMPKLPHDKNMKRGDIHYQYSEEIIYVKWKDNRGVVLLGSNIGGDCSSVQWYGKGMSSKTSFPCAQLAKGYNKGMEGVDLMDEFTSTYRLDRSKTLYYLSLFFDFWDMTLVNAYIVYDKLKQKKLSHADFQVIVVKSLIGNCNNWRRNPQTFRTTKRVKSWQESLLQEPTQNKQNIC